MTAPKGSCRVTVHPPRRRVVAARQFGVILVTLIVLGGCSTAQTTAPKIRTKLTPSPSQLDGGLSTAPSPTVSDPVAPPSTVPQAARYLNRCSARQLTLGQGEGVSEATGQHTLSMTLTNRGSVGCYIYGYPGVSLIDESGHTLPMDYRRSGDQMVTSRPPTHVDVDPGSVAYVTVNKYRCDTHTVMRASVVRLIPPDETTSLQLALGGVGLDYCGAGDPGSIVAISPVEATYLATTPF